MTLTAHTNPSQILGKTPEILAKIPAQILAQILVEIPLKIGGKLPEISGQISAKIPPKLPSKILALAFLFGLNACVPGGDAPLYFFQSQRDAVHAHYKIGDPYQIEGIWYYPKRDLRYDNTGIASWYGDEFAGRFTANGEIFNPNLISAAHKTLPMPSVVRVTNLDNGKALVVRINDRGPYVAGRIIDLSREAANLLGFQKQGTAKVRVQILPEKSVRLEKLARAGKFPLLGEKGNLFVPESIPAKPPTVSLSARTTNANTSRNTGGASAINLLAGAEVGELTETTPVQTEIWIQVGAFHSLKNAETVLEKLRPISRGKLFRLVRNDEIFYRARLGPIKTVKNADSLLSIIHRQGYDGADIIVE